MRIALALLLLVWWAFLWPTLPLWFVDGGPVDPELLATNWSPYRLRLLDGLSVGELQAVWGLGVLATLGLLFGFGTPIVNAVLVLLLAAFWHRSPWIQNGGDRLLRIFTFYMLFADSGKAWSIDARLRGVRDATVSSFALRLIQMQLVVMYTYTGLAKLTGFTWIDGTAIYYALSDAGYARFSRFFDRVLTYAPVQLLTRLLTWLTLVWEIAFGPLVAWSRTRTATLLFGVALHVGIFALLAVGIFSWSTLWGYLAFLPNGWAGRLADRLRSRKP